MDTLSGVDRVSLERYAQLIVTRGCNVQPGQFFQIGADAESTDFAAVVARASSSALEHIGSGAAQRGNALARTKAPPDCYSHKGAARQLRLAASPARGRPGGHLRRS